MAKTEYGLQMYSVRDITKDSMRMALEKVAAMGYHYVEFAGFFDYTAEQIKLWLDTFGLECSGTHTGLGALTPENIDATIAYHQAIGCKNLIVPGADWSTEEKMNENIAALNAAQKKLAAAGIRLGYHNHSGEFFPSAYGKVIEEEVIKNTEIELEIDTFWAYNAKQNVVELLERLKDRITVVHLKDGTPAPNVENDQAHCHAGAVGLSVGSGTAPVCAVREWANKNGVLMVVESEGLNPTGLEEVERCITFLKTLD